MAETGTLKLKLNYGTSLNAKSCLKLLRQLVSLAAVVIIAVLISLALASQTKHIVLPSRFQDFLTLSLSIVVEAVPFIILGAIVGSFIQAFVSQTTMLKVLPKRPAFRRLVLSLGGSIFPVCECGNVPVARSLLAKGLETSEATTFLLAAPILNPLTIITTWEAFRFNRSMVAIRLISAFVIANLIGWLLHHYPKQEDLLVDTSRQFKEEKRHQHHHDLDYKKNRFISIFRTEFWSMFSMLSIGAFVAAGSQTFIPRSALLSLGSQPVLSILAMLALAFILSLCANVDAFFALAYSNIFTFGALAAFLVFGPMIDIKTLLLMKTTFKTKTLIMITSICLLSSLSLGLVINHGL